jgi:DNA-binding response OmpR family regulator
MTQRRKGRRVLVVEDEFMVAMGLEMVLSDAGYEVVGPIGRFEQALAAASGEKVDVALLDVNVRGQTVFPVADILSGRGVPFAFLTGYGRDSLPAAQANANVLAKPFKAPELLAAVDAMLM